jgi:cell division protein FtsX
MNFFVEHAYAVAGLLLAILALHIAEHLLRGKAVFAAAAASANLVMHILLTAYFLLNGAGMEELLLVLLLSLSVGLVRKEGEGKGKV